MTISSQHSYIAFDDADAALTFYRDVVGFEVSNDVDMGGGMRWITLNPVGQDVSIVLTPVGAGESDADREVMADLLAKGVDRKSTRLNSSHVKISYAVFCLKK